MVDQYVTLPDLYITGGTSDEIIFNMFSSASVPLDLSDCDVNFSVSRYADVDGQPVISYSSTDTISNIDINENEICVGIDPVDTKSLRGKYTYQITIKDEEYGYVSYQGVLFVKKNINPDFVESEVQNAN